MGRGREGSQGARKARAGVYCRAVGCAAKGDALKLTGNRHVLMCLGRALKWFEDYETEPADRWLHWPTLFAEEVAHRRALYAFLGQAEPDTPPVVIGRAQTIEGIECDADDARAWRFSLAGIAEAMAFKHVLAVEGSASPELARKLAGEVFTAIAAALPAGAPGVVAFNDNPETTFADVCRVLRAAILKESRGANVIEERDAIAN